MDHLSDETQDTQKSNLEFQEENPREFSAEAPGESDDAQTGHIKGVVETILFINERPVTLAQFKRVLETVDARIIKNAIELLKDEYARRQSGIIIKEIAEGYQMLSNPLFASYARDFYKTKHKEKLSKPALETVAIIAYKQPVTRMEIELIRGVNSDGVFNSLVTKELIKIVGRKDAPGKPYMYGTTKQFLEYFGLGSLMDLPKLEEFADLLPQAEKDMEEGESLDLSGVDKIEEQRGTEAAGQESLETFDEETDDHEYFESEEEDRSDR